MYSQIIETDCPPGKRTVTEFLAKLVKSTFGLSIHSKTALLSDKPRIFFANHTSHLDFLLLWSALPVSVRDRTVAAAAADYWCHNKVRRWIAGHFFKAIMIERKSICRRNNPVSAILKSLDNGQSVIVFPEGGRTDGPDVSELKSGLYHIAKKRPEIELIPRIHQKR